MRVIPDRCSSVLFAFASFKRVRDLMLLIGIADSFFYEKNGFNNEVKWLPRRLTWISGADLESNDSSEKKVPMIP